MNFKYVLRIFITALLILSLIIFINYFGLKLNERYVPKKLLQVVTIEGLTPASSSSTAFCDVNKGYKLEQSCGKLTKYNCGLTSCCVWSSENKCKAGNISGPLFNSDSNGKTMPIDYYYFQNKCYGENCPNKQAS